MRNREEYRVFCILSGRKTLEFVFGKLDEDDESVEVREAWGQRRVDRENTRQKIQSNKI